MKTAADPDIRAKVSEKEFSSSKFGRLQELEVRMRENADGEKLFQNFGDFLAIIRYNCA